MVENDKNNINEVNFYKAALSIYGSYSLLKDGALMFLSGLGILITSILPLNKLDKMLIIITFISTIYWVFKACDRTKKYLEYIINDKDDYKLARRKINTTDKIATINFFIAWFITLVVIFYN